MLSKERQRRGQSDLQLLIEELSTRSRKPQIKRTPRFLFRALVRTVINNLKWLKGILSCNKNHNNNNPIYKNFILRGRNRR